MSHLSTPASSSSRFSRLESCIFGYYTHAELLKLSVCEVTENRALSSIGTAEKNGMIIFYNLLKSI